ncbi:hypothetical protein PybrP1_001498 [[Pythium] brassicae (nom. inval.)]|nr:hypothetical protein PybrP1_001498 [[Pythium] brassicae (nom. inval.)]
MARDSLRPQDSSEQREQLLCVHAEPNDPDADDALRLTPRRSRLLRRADAACLAVVVAVACYVALYTPARRLENPFFLVRAPPPPTSTRSQFLTYADIAPAQRAHGYTVRATARGFEIDGRRTLLLGGSVHYARSTPGMWEDILLKARHDGLNHVQMCACALARADVFWNFHEQERGVFDLSGGRNLTRFYELAARLGLFLHVRFGPYVCAEWANGGLPVWLNWVPGMKVRASNAPWQAEMARFLTHMVALARPFLAENGGPIILAQIENEFNGDDPEYIAWCGDLVRGLNTSIPWVMYVAGDAALEPSRETLSASRADTDSGRVVVCRVVCGREGSRCNGKSAANTILACNGDDCVTFAQNQTRDRPTQPLIWTENEGWYEKWADKTPGGSTDNDQRSAASMYHGGNNYGRSAAAGVTTMYADGVNLHADGLSNEPKRSHLRALHSALISVNNALMASPRQLPFPKPIAETTATDLILSSSEPPPQRAYVYGDSSDQQVTFLENAADDGAPVRFNGSAYYLAGKSVVMVTTSARVVFNTSDVTGSFPHELRRVYSPLVAEAELTWLTWSELWGARGVPRKQVTSASPLEQLHVTRDRTDYLTYETSFQLAPTVTAPNATLTVTTCDANSVLVFLDHRFVAEQHLAYPGGNCSKQFQFVLPTADEEDNSDNDSASADAPKRFHLSLVSVSLGLFSLGHNHKKGITGAVRINDDLDLTHNGHWTMLPGLVGEQLELFDPEWTDSVEWTPVPRPVPDARTTTAANVGFPLMAWYRTTFRLPDSARPTPGGSPVEDVSSILLDCVGLTRGRAYVNGHDLGRYWLIRDAATDRYVQRYYHVPTEWLRFGSGSAAENLVVVVDELGGSVARVRLVLSTIVEQPLESAAAPAIGAEAAQAVE